jgi:hypothetical protein
MKTNTMWSFNQPSNQEDDGLEPIVGSMGVRPSTPPRLPVHMPSPAVGGSVVPPSGVRVRAQEPTLILRERQLDSVRAHVQRQKRSAKLKRYMGTVAWVIAGGFAVLVGAILARGVRTFFEPGTTPSDEAPLEAAALPSSALPPSSAEPPRDRDEQPHTEGPTTRPARRPALRLDEIPTE